MTTRKTLVPNGEAEKLHGLWREALAAHHKYDTDKTSSAEQAAHDELVDYVEANGLNYTAYDPRGVDPHASICRHCGADIRNDDISDGIVWTDQLSGDDGGTYDCCPEAVYHEPTR